MCALTVSMRLLTLLVLVATCALYAPGVARAQDVPAAAQAPHRFFDTANIALTAMESAALLADGITTQQARNRYPEFFREADPIARPFVEAGWTGQILGGVLVVSADVGLRYWLHRTNHHRIERLLPMVLTTYGTVCAIHNVREMNRMERSLGGAMVLISIGR
jgi:hypothetical protein